MIDSGRCLVVTTGASGFIGNALMLELDHRAIATRALLRRAGSGATGRHETKAIGDFESVPRFEPFLHGADTIIHLAGLAHQGTGASAETGARYRSVNANVTVRLATEAARVGARHFIFLSTAQVHGRLSSGRAYSEADEPNPSDAYSQSKWEAEIGLREVAAATGLNVTVIRPPLVYGPGVKANFLQLLRFVQLGVPLPLKGSEAKRSMIFVGNLVHLIAYLLGRPEASFNTYLVSDDETLTVRELAESLARHLGREPRSFAIPRPIRALIDVIPSIRNKLQRVEQDFEIDSSLVRRETGWSPPFGVEEGIRRTVEHFRSNARFR